MKIESTFGLYGILTDPVVGYLQLAREMVRHGVRFIQLRMKDAKRDEIAAIGSKLRSIITGDSLFIVNDDPHIAVEVGADGVHLGHGDMPYKEARKIMGQDAIVGLSTHNLEQTKNASALRPDYIGIGPVYATPTKKNPDPPIGIDGMRAMLDTATVPAVVLGSIDDQNAATVLQAGARNICCVRYINRSNRPERELKRILRIIEAV